MFLTGAHIPDQEVDLYIGLFLYKNRSMYWSNQEAKALTPAQLGQRKNVHTMLLCKIITGQSCLGKSGMPQPTAGYHSAIDRLNDPQMFIISNPDQILPVNIVEYCVG